MVVTIVVQSVEGPLRSASNITPLERDNVPYWLSNPASEPGENFDEHKEIWANFLISRDLLLGLSSGNSNYQCGVEYCNTAQLARQFGMLQLVPIPPYRSKNEGFTTRPVLALEALEEVFNGFTNAKAQFKLLSYEESPEKTAQFDTWWQEYIGRQFVEPLEAVLARIAPPPQKEKGKGASKAGTTSTTTVSKAKGASKADTVSTATGGKREGNLSLN